MHDLVANPYIYSLCAHTRTQAYVHLARLERQRVEHEREREEAERKRKREEMKRIKRILEAAFDGDIQEIKAVLKEVGNKGTECRTVDHAVFSTLHISERHCTMEIRCYLHHCTILSPIYTPAKYRTNM